MNDEYDMMNMIMIYKKNN